MGLTGLLLGGEVLIPTWGKSDQKIHVEIEILVHM